MADADTQKQLLLALWDPEGSTHHLDLEALAADSVADMAGEVGSEVDSAVIAVVIVDSVDVVGSGTKAGAAVLAVSPMVLVAASHL